MGAFIFNIAKGKVGYYGALPATDALVWLILNSSGLESDANMKDRATVAAVVGNSTETAFGGYARVVHNASGVVAVDNTNDWVTADDTTDPVWSPSSAVAIGKIVCAYDPASSSGASADSALIPLFADDFALTTPVSGSITYQVAAGGYFKAS